MKPRIRAAMAAVALNHATARTISSVYSSSDAGYQNIHITAGCHINGSAGGWLSFLSCGKFPGND
jgi:hypothetical protein